jgi:hypothetical protein
LKEAVEPTSPSAIRGALDERVAARRSLILGGLSAEEAAYWCAAWEAEAERQGLSSKSSYFWDAGFGWIDAQRSFRVKQVRAGVGAKDRPTP